MAAQRTGDEGQRPAGSGEAGGSGVDARQAAELAVDFAETMIGQQPEAVVAAEPVESGWLVTVEVLELARVPDTADVLASYEVEIDAGGEPHAYRRTRRYQRSWTGDQ